MIIQTKLTLYVVQYTTYSVDHTPCTLNIKIGHPSWYTIISPMTEYLSSDEVNDIIAQAVVYGDFTLVSGAKSDKKFDFDRIETNSDVFRVLVQALTRCIKDTSPDIDGIITIASSATRLGDPIAAKLDGVTHIKSTSVINPSGSKHFKIDQIPSGTTKVVLVDDVFTRGTNATKIADALPSNIKIENIAVILDRSGQTNPRILKNIAVSSLIRRTLE